MNPHSLAAYLAALDARSHRKAPDTVVHPTISLVLDGAAHVAVPEDVYNRLVDEHAASAAYAAQVAELEGKVAAIARERDEVYRVSSWQAGHITEARIDRDKARDDLAIAIAERDGNAELVRAQAKHIADLEAMLAEAQAKLRSQADRHAEGRDRDAATIANLKAQLARMYTTPVGEMFAAYDRAQREASEARDHLDCIAQVEVTTSPNGEPELVTVTYGGEKIVAVAREYESKPPAGWAPGRNHLYPPKARNITTTQRAEAPVEREARKAEDLPRFTTRGYL